MNSIIVEPQPSTVEHFSPETLNVWLNTVGEAMCASLKNYGPPESVLKEEQIADISNVLSYPLASAMSGLQFDKPEDLLPIGKPEAAFFNDFIQDVMMRPDELSPLHAYGRPLQHAMRRHFLQTRRAPEQQLNRANAGGRVTASAADLITGHFNRTFFGWVQGPVVRVDTDSYNRSMVELIRAHKEMSGDEIKSHTSPNNVANLALASASKW